jgi:pyruvate kinase
LAQHGSQVKVIAKIENHEGLHNFDEILIEADGIILSRNEISMEIPPEKVFIAQKWMTEKSNLAGKPILMFQQIFDSMMKYPRPSRAEANEVSNAVLDGVDGFILDTETAEGDYPVNCVSSLVKCATEAERTIDWRKCFNDIKLYSPGPYGSAESVACAAVNSVLDLKVDLIVVSTETGKLARMVSKYKPEVPIICVSLSDVIV